MLYTVSLFWYLATNCKKLRILMGYVVFVTNRWRKHVPAKRWYPCRKLHGVTSLRLSERLSNITYLTMFIWACLSSASITYCGLRAFTVQHNIITSNSFIRQWHYSTLLGPGLFFSFVICFYTVGRTPGTGDQPIARPLPAHRATQTE
jgi:hypothetical protein